MGVLLALLPYSKSGIFGWVNQPFYIFYILFYPSSSSLGGVGL